MRFTCWHMRHLTLTIPDATRYLARFHSVFRVCAIQTYSIYSTCTGRPHTFSYHRNPLFLTIHHERAIPAKAQDTFRLLIFLHHAPTTDVRNTPRKPDHWLGQTNRAVFGSSAYGLPAHCIQQFQRAFGTRPNQHTPSPVRKATAAAYAFR